MLKAISTVIASILMLMIVIVLGGTTYLYISETFTARTATTFEIIDAINDTVTIRNSGTEIIERITATLDGEAENIAIFSNIDGLIGYWSFNDGNGTVAKDSFDDNDGSLFSNIQCSDPPTSGCPKWIVGKFSNALQFDGSNDYVNVGNLGIPQNGEATIAGWFYFNDLAKEKGSDIYLYGNFFYQHPVNNWFYILGTDDHFRWVPETDKWYHLVLTYSGQSPTAKLYVNGMTYNIVDALGGANDIKAFPGLISWSSSAFKGAIDEVAIYTKVLSDSEIKQLYSGLVSPGQLATVKPLTTLSKGTHTLRLCTSIMCNTAILTVR